MVEKRPGWVSFAAIMMFWLAGWALLATIADFTNPSWLDGSMIGQQKDFLLFGLFDLAIAILALVAGIAVWRGQKWGMWLGIIIAGLQSLRALLAIQISLVLGITFSFVWGIIVFALIMNLDYFEERSM
jgi:hypothetical protein